MDEDRSDNIFDEAGKQRPKKSSEERLKRRLPDAPKSDKVPSDDEVKSMFQRMKEIQNDINEKMFSVYEKSGVPLDKIEDFLKDPKGLDERVQRHLDEDMQKLEGEVTGVLGARGKRLAKKVREKKEGKKRKKKFIGKRRNWLEM